MAERLKAWWWIVRHPFKSIAIRRWFNKQREDDAR